jgi:hypothetical protein
VQYQCPYSCKSNRVTADFWTETWEARKKWNDIFQTPEKNNFQTILLYPEKLSFIIKEEIKTFHDEQKLKELMTTKSALQKILQEILYAEDEAKYNHENMDHNDSH